MGIKVITVGREYGSGGRIIGKKIAEELGFDFYDKELIGMMARESGYAEEYIEKNAENMDTKTSRLMFNAFTSGAYALGMYSSLDVSTADQIYSMQSRLINDIAEKKPCVIVGRCADYILRKHMECLNIFIHANVKFREERAVKEYGISEKNAKKEIQWQDRTRASYYKYYTEIEWGKAANYHVTLDSGVFGVDGCVKVITSIVRSSLL